MVLLVDLLYVIVHQTGNPHFAAAFVAESSRDLKSIFLFPDGLVDFDFLQGVARFSAAFCAEIPLIFHGGTAPINAIPAVRELCDTLEGDERTGAKIVLKALEAPLRQIAKNAGLEGSVIIDKIVSANKPNYGFDAQNEVFVEDMIAAGIVDPTKVTRSALENAASVAEMVLTTESLVADLPEPPAAPAAAGGDMGGMGGMY